LVNSHILHMQAAKQGCTYRGWGVQATRLYKVATPSHTSQNVQGSIETRSVSLLSSYVSIVNACTVFVYFECINVCCSFCLVKLFVNLCEKVVIVQTEILSNVVPIQVCVIVCISTRTDQKIQNCAYLYSRGDSHYYLQGL